MERKNCRQQHKKSFDGLIFKFSKIFSFVKPITKIKDLFALYIKNQKTELKIFGQHFNFRRPIRLRIIEFMEIADFFEDYGNNLLECRFNTNSHLVRVSNEAVVKTVRFEKLRFSSARLNIIPA